MLQAGLLVGFWELCIGADLKERESVVAWEMGKGQGLRVVLLGRAKLFPLAVPVLVPGALLGLVQLLKAEEAAGVSVM